MSGLAAEFADNRGSVFEPDAVLPSQFFGVDEGGMRGGERKLMAALLSDGIEAYMSLLSEASIAAASGESAKESDVQREAREWVETVDNTYIFSFDLVCESLGIDPGYLRLGLQRYAESIQCGNPGVQRWRRIRRPRK